MTGLPALLQQARSEGDRLHFDIPADWMQGRTAFGGLSSALALRAALAASPELPPLRSAQIAFVGPLAGAVTVEARLLRRGRNVAFVEADLSGEAGLGLRATFVFMAPLASSIMHDSAPQAPRSVPPTDASLYVGPPGFFTHNFEFHDDKAVLEPAEWLRWARLREREDLDPPMELLAVGDALPPAAFRLLPEPRPLSSLTWQLNLLTAAPSTRDGWWLLHAHADHARDGHSSQRMRIWNADGVLVAEAMQSVAIFG
ncbi:thioesterase family protein [Sphingomonas baiyangensis]|uniref:Thioesterase family protein n=1 Tax=Sphingomonas baiyangensis TaxID=2572576 RepID=A0A4U1L100_9SPHN|nr:thioesterase family protein [Sphingomonas baiyangensis]TKD50461.1 thioesterase family protein [Sphingomonas baiyangensis]